VKIRYKMSAFRISHDEVVKRILEKEEQGIEVKIKDYPKIRDELIRERRQEKEKIKNIRERFKDLPLEEYTKEYNKLDEKYKLYIDSPDKIRKQKEEQEKKANQNKARAALEEGKTLFDSKKYEDALHRFEYVGQIVPNSESDNYISLCREMLNFQKGFTEYYGDLRKVPDYILEIVKKNYSRLSEIKADLQSFNEESKTHWKKLNETKNKFDYSEKEGCLLYNLYYLPVHFLKLAIFFEELFNNRSINREWFEDKQEIVIWDIGSGPGTMVLAFLDFCHFLKTKLGYKIPKLKFYITEKIDYFNNIRAVNIGYLGEDKFIRLNTDNQRETMEDSKVYYHIENTSIKNICQLISDNNKINFQSDLIILAHILKEIKEECSKLFDLAENNLKLKGLICCIETQDIDSKDIFKYLKNKKTEHTKKILERCVWSPFLSGCPGNCENHELIHSEKIPADFGNFINELRSAGCTKIATNLSYRLLGFRRE
jgi:hypothetical protein